MTICEQVVKEPSASLSSVRPLPSEIDYLLAEAVEAAANGIVITNRQGTILWTNAAFTKMTGYSREEAVGKHTRILKSGSHDADFYSQLWKTVSAGNVWHGTVCNRRKDGSTYPEEMTITPIRDAEGQIGHFIAIKQDISEKRQLEEHDSRLVAVLEATPDFVGIADPQGRPLFVNRAGRQMTGCEEAEDLYPHIENYHPGWAGKIVRNEGIPSAVRTGAWMGETALLTREGREIPVSQVIVAHRYANGEVQFFSTIMRDLTERRKLEGQLYQSQKMEAIGQLAGGVAHDFNNLLTIISGYSEVLLTRLPATDPASGLLEEIHKAGERAAGLTRQLLAFSRKQIIQPKVLDLNTLVSDVGKMLRRMIGEDVTLTTVLAPRLGRVKADPGQIEQVLMNLAVNARDAMPQGGKFAIETANVELDENSIQGRPEVQPGCYVLLAVSDTGCGMTKETKAHIFEPFFTTKELGKGTGLGLATTYGIVKQSGGYIYVYSEPGHGTTFKIYLPLVEDGVPSGKSHINPKTMPQGSETILLVEDEDAVRSLTRYTLQMQGYVVLEARDGEEALRVAEQHQGQIHLLMTDVVMPRMGGRQVAERLTQAQPALKLLFVSGYTDDAVVRHGVMASEVAFLQKPFTPSALTQKVRDVLDQ